MQALWLPTRCIQWAHLWNVLWLIHVNHTPFCLYCACAAYEGMEEYSSIKFAVRKQKLAITDKGDGPMVCNTPTHHPPTPSHITRPHHTHRWSVGVLSVGMTRWRTPLSRHEEQTRDKLCSTLVQSASKSTAIKLLQCGVTIYGFSYCRFKETENSWQTID